jgi:hypothetical protein
MELFEEVSGGMITKDTHPLVGRPFMEIDADQQFLAFEHLRKLLLG